MLKRWVFVFLVIAVPAASQVREGAWTPVAETMRRGYTSLSYWTYRDDGVEIGGGRISIEHGLPEWPEKYDDQEAFDQATTGMFWRFGNNKWTTLDTQLGLVFGDRRVDAGIYYLALEREKTGTWRMVFVDPEAVRPGLIDAWALVPRPDEVPVLFSVPLRYERAAASAKELAVELGFRDGEMDRGVLQIRWGPHQLSGDFQIEMVAPDFYER
ncbi:MAG TPA: DUF2911 domain-containing protein [Vicinamibacteria bacterium]|nr:DUF2911 domain-containing protein [Vicinamibacteria bacterium]